MNLMVVAESESLARSIMIENVNAWRWHNPPRFDKILEALQLPPFFVADPGHVITIQGEID